MSKNEPKILKTNKNVENAKNERKQIKPFGTLPEPELSQKNVLRSWDRDLSIGDVKWSIGRKSKLEKGPLVANESKMDARV